MKKFYLLIILLVSTFGFAQGQKYIIKISNLSYSINAGVKNKTSSNIRITVHYKDGSSSNAYTRDIRNNGDREVNLDIAAFSRNSKPVSIECYAFVNFRTGTDANSSVYKSVDTFCPSGSFSGSYSPRMSNITFNYKIDPVFYVNRSDVNDDLLPTHTKKTILATPGYDDQYYRWQYSLIPNATATQWQDLPKYNTEPNITVDAVDILGANAGLYIGKYIYFRIKPCTETPGLSTPISYSIRLSAPKVNTVTPVKPRCTNTNDGSVELVFDRTLLNGEQLNYTLLDVSTGTPTDYRGVLAINANKTFNITGLAAGTYTLQLIGFKDGLNTSVGDPLDKNLFALSTFTILPPTPVDFTLSSTNVNCFGSKDGTLTINASGGTKEGYEYSLTNGNTWIAFTNPKSQEEIIKGLFPITKPSITYSVMVRDKNGCLAKLDDKTKVLTETISEPLAPLSLEYTLKNDPAFFGASNGILVAAVTGGTIFDDNNADKYEYEWRNSAGVKMPVLAEYNTTLKTYYLTLENVPAGNYKLTVKDKNYSKATNKTGCSIIESSNDLVEPKKIEITLEIGKEISCNSANLGEIENQIKASASDGMLIAKIKGGKKLDPKVNNGIPYYFNWKMLNDKGEWEELKDKKDSIASGLSKGIYSLNVIDANGISQGTYSLYKQLTEVATEQPIAEPDVMKVIFSSGDVSCFEGDNGHAKASIENGKSSYSYTWYGPGHAGVVAEELSNLVKGMYYVDVLDLVNGCFVKDSVEIKEPKAKLEVRYLKKTAPTYAGATNGKIVAEIIGGTDDNGTYSFTWKNKAGTVQIATGLVGVDKYIITLDGIPADTYFLTVTDKNYDLAGQQIVNCSILDYEVELTEPQPLRVTFEKKDISCNADNEFGNSKDTNPDDGQRDESQDGILIAHVTGGVNLDSSDNNSLPYYYSWKKEQLDGTWKNLAIQDSIAPNLSHGNYAFNVEDANGIVLGVYANNQLVEKIDVIQFMQQPPKLTVSITSGNVFCYAGNDGWATAIAAGGTPPYEYRWSNGVEIDKNTVLKTGTYTVFVTDFNKCTTQKSIFINEPKTALSIEYKEVLNPSFYKATNGKIVVEVTGGTISTNNSYWFEWKNSKGIVQTTTTASFSNGIYTISLNGVGEENYSLTVRDANYDAATNKTSCTVANSVMALDDPDPLEVTFEVLRTISCNVSNEFGNETDADPQDNQRDESQDGILVAHVTGGIQLKADQNNGLPYFYTWKKQQGNSWIIWNDHDQTAENISDGTYALNIEDANGIKLGTYVNNLLVQEKDVTHYMPEPAKLQLSFTKFDVGCTTGDDGWAEVHVSGGTPPYTYEWTNGETTPKIENITTNNYFVIATDAKGCVVQGSIFVGDPNGIFTTETVKNPTCYKGNDASIALNVTGGNLPYSYLWNNGSISKDLNNLTAGNYEVAITCPDCCVYKKRFVLKDPEPIIVNVGPDRTLCIDQNLDLDATITDQKALYSWTSTNGFTSNEAKVNVSKAGTYHVKVTSGLGCIGEDEIIVKTSQTAISSEFLVSSQAYLDEEVILVNTSNPFGESTNWVIPKGVKVVEQKEKYITLKFDATGVYAIGLQQTQGECYAVYSKNITVEQRDALPNVATTSQFIVDFIVTPNPSNGNFKAHVALENNSAINLRLFSTTGQNTMIQKKEAGKKKYEIDFETTLESGMYVLVLETGQQTLVKKIIIY